MDNQTSNSNNKVMSHIAVSVPDLDKAVKGYHEVLGFNILTKQMKGKSNHSSGKVISV